MSSEPSPTSEPSAYEKNVREQYECLGRFVEAFEIMVNEVRRTCVELLSPDTEHAKLVRVPFHHPAMTAKPLFDIMRGIIGQMLKDEKFRKRHGITDEDYTAFLGVLATINAEYEKLANMRNDLLHGTWRIGYVGGPEDMHAPEFRIERHRVGKHGLSEAEGLPKDASQLRGLARRCEGTWAWISTLVSCVPRVPGELQISKCFRHDGKQWTRIHPRMFATSPQTLPVP
jgi:hypothetical protein